MPAPEAPAPTTSLARYPRFDHLTTEVSRLLLAPPECAPIPHLEDPARQPVGPLPYVGDWDTLTPVAQRDRRIIDLAAYAGIGVPGAPSVSMARASVVRRLRKAANLLPEHYGLAVFDAWRPLEVQQALYCAAYTEPGLPHGYVTPPSRDPSTPPPHLTGGTVDLTLTWHGKPLGLGTAFDDFTPQAHTDAFEALPGTVQAHRRLLYAVMTASGFVNLACEWWHFEFGTRRWAAITGNPVFLSAIEPHTI